MPFPQYYLKSHSSDFNHHLGVLMRAVIKIMRSSNRSNDPYSVFLTHEATTNNFDSFDTDAHQLSSFFPEKTAEKEKKRKEAKDR